MKKLLMIFIAVLLASFPLFAEEKKIVSLRYSQHDDILRVVLEAEDAFIKNANMIATLSGVKIDFPAPFELKKQKDFIFDAAGRDHFLTITLKNIIDVRTYKLTSPARIVIDLKTDQKPVKEQTAGPDKIDQKQKPEQPAEKPRVPAVFFLDAGHGGYDYGIPGKDTKEKDLNLLMTKELSAALSKKGEKVFLTRKADQSLSLPDRVVLVNSRKPDMVISIHSSVSNAFVVYTAAVDEQAADSAVKLYSLSARQGRHIEKSRGMATAIGQALKDEFKGDVLLRELPLPLLNSIDAAAVLIEYPSLQLNTYDQKMRDRFINAVVKGINSQ